MENTNTKVENTYNTITLFVKEREIKKGERAGQTFPDYFCKINGTDVTVSVNLTKIAKAQIDANKITLPVGIVLGENDFFIKEDTYEDANGITLPKDVIVLTNISKLCEPELRKKTLADLVNKQ